MNVCIHKGLDVPTLTRNGLHRRIRWEEPSNMLDRLFTCLLNRLVMQTSNLNKTNWITIYITKMWFRAYLITIPSCLCVCEAKVSGLVILLSIVISAGPTLRISMVLTRPVTFLQVCCIEKPGSAQTQIQFFVYKVSAFAAAILFWSPLYFFSVFWILTFHIMLPSEHYLWL